MRDLLWLIPLLPFVGALLNATVLWNRAGKKVVAAVACGTVGLAAVLGLVAIGLYMGSPEHAAKLKELQTLLAAEQKTWGDTLAPVK